MLETVDGEESDIGDHDGEPVLEERDLLEELHAAVGKVETSADTEGKNSYGVGPAGVERVEQRLEGGKTDLFGSAKEAVLNIVKKAAEVLVKTPGNQSAACGQGGPLQYRHCFTPSHQVVCNNCSETFYIKYVFNYSKTNNMI